MPSGLVDEEDGEVVEAALGEAVVAGPVVGDDLRARHNDAFDEAAEEMPHYDPGRWRAEHARQ